MANSFGQLFRITTWGESHGASRPGQIDENVDATKNLGFSAEELLKIEGALTER
jgi:chorismate synthase